MLLVDDICSTGETLLKASRVCKNAGAKRLYAAVTHGLFVGKALEESAIEKIFVTNTIPLRGSAVSRNIEMVSVAGLFAQAIDSIVHARSISSLSRAIVDNNFLNFVWRRTHEIERAEAHK